MRKFILLLLMMPMLGCAGSIMSYEQIMQSAQQTNTSDGVDRQEAIVLAQDYLIEKGLDAQHSVYRVGEVTKEGNTWFVQFNSGIARGASQNRQFDFVAPITVKVDASTGMVK